MPGHIVIAEIGINHDGSMDTARTLISEAASAGVRGIKFQYRNLDNAYSVGAREIGDEMLEHEIHENFLSPQKILDLTKYGKDLGLEVGTSFFDAIDMEDFGSDIGTFDFFKVPSAELTNASLIDAMLQTGKHVYISTGCHSEDELEAALGRLPAQGWTPLHCVSNYPTAIQNPRLGYLRHLADRWNRDVGYSSHDDNWEVTLLAMQNGATVIERHITLDRSAEGLDHSSSSTPEEFETMCLFAENMEFILTGDGARVQNQGELLNRQNLGRSYYIDRDMAAGEVIDRDSLQYRSPSVGVSNADIDQYIGKPVAAPLLRGTPISRSVFDIPAPLSSEIIEFSKSHSLSLPVRLHDVGSIAEEFPIGAFEFHLSFREAMSGLDIPSPDKSNRYSIHLPDYINSTQLMDPLSRDSHQRAASLDILQRTCDFATRLQQLTGKPVPIVGSFSVVDDRLEDFYGGYAELLGGIRETGVNVLPQWLPPIAWYFGGSIRLHAMNDLVDVELMKKLELPICLDVCHLLMGQHFFGFSAQDVLQNLRANVAHIHIADSAGIDGEGLAFGEGDPGNMDVIGATMDWDCLKVIEVWQGHLDRGAGFRKALSSLWRMYGG